MAMMQSGGIDDGRASGSKKTKSASRPARDGALCGRQAREPSGRGREPSGSLLER